MVTKLTIDPSGDNIGFGYVHEGCGECEHCIAGYTWHCENKRAYGVNDFDQGSFATHSVWPASRLIKLPDEIANEDAGPFMCAGQTVFVPLWRNKVKKGDRVGVIGIGGLGHLAIQFAAAWGCEVVVFSSSDNKKEEALAFGAKEFHNTKSLEGKDIGKLNHLIVTTSMIPDWSL
jgi:D-arabinose 1-dehydrogenase-like Zn-dependent alcohol dehydrogenase